MSADGDVKWKTTVSDQLQVDLNQQKSRATISYREAVRTVSLYLIAIRKMPLKRNVLIVQQPTSISKALIDSDSQDLSAAKRY